MLKFSFIACITSSALTRGANALANTDAELMLSDEITGGDEFAGADSVCAAFRVVVFLFVAILAESAIAGPKTWTLNNVTTTGGVSWTGTFDYDAETNTYSSIDIATTLGGAPNPWTTLSTDSFLNVGCMDPATASGLTIGFNAEGVTIFCMDFSVPLTNNGGTVNLLTGGIGWATLGTSGAITSGTISAPVTWTLNNVATTGGVSWTGTFDYDAETNTYSSIDIATTLGGAPNPWTTLSTDSFLNVGCMDPATASGLTIGFNAEGVTIFCMDFSVPLTNNGGTVNLLTGGIGWATLGTSGAITSGIISAVPPEISVGLDIQPGKIGNVVHPNHNDVNVSPYLDDVIRVAVLGSMTSVGDPVDLDTDTIDPATLHFGPGAGAINPASTPLFKQNVDNDGIDDAIFEFQTSASAISCGETSAVLTGSTTSGQPFEGGDMVDTNCDATCHN